MAESSNPDEALARRTISAFGEQWTKYVENNGYYGSKTLFDDICGPLLESNDLVGTRVADIGSGTGRIVRMLVDSGVSHVLGIEPSDAFAALERNTAALGDRVTLLRETGERIPTDQNFDYVFSIGVLHHIPDPRSVLRAVRRALRPGGRLLIWVYAHEGNERYLAFVSPLRKVTTRLPHTLVALVAFAGACAVSVLHVVARWVGLPQPEYVRSKFSKLTFANRRLVIYDQLRPAYAKYYRQQEIRALLEDCGFHQVVTYHRHAYSWTVIGTNAGRHDEREFTNG